MPGTFLNSMTSNPTEDTVKPLSAVDAATRGIDVDKLVREAQTGNEAAFNALVTAFSGLIYNLAYRMAGNAADAEELSQEVFVKLFRSIRKFRWKSKFSTWLYALAINSNRSGLRKIRRISGREVVRLDNRDTTEIPCRETIDPGERPGDAMMRNEVQARVESAIATLASVYRQVIILRDLQGLTYEEIATALGCSLGTVKSRLARARMRVKDLLLKAGDRQ